MITDPKNEAVFQKPGFRNAQDGVQTIEGEIKRLWNDVHDRKLDQENLVQKFQDIESEFNRIKGILKDCANSGFQELHRL